MSATPKAVGIGPRTIAVLAIASVFGVVAFAWPLFVSRGSAVGASSFAPVIFGALLLLVLGVVLAQLSEGGLDAKALALLGVLSALGAVVRPLGAGTAGVETIFFLLVVAGRAFGPGFGFSLGCTTLFASALVTGGVGPWMPYQMFACAWIGLGADSCRGRAAGARSPCSWATAPRPRSSTDCCSTCRSGRSRSVRARGCRSFPAPRSSRTCTGICCST